jgi:Protein of unknown function (DUF3142)
MYGAFIPQPKLPSLLLLALLPALLSASCRPRPIAGPAVSDANLPHVILWAWERPEDLEFLDPQTYGVAFLAQTLILKNDDVILNPRRQPLKVSPATKLIAVTRIESQKTTGTRAALSAAQRERLVALIAKTLELRNVLGIQVDYDAAVSEREFYRALLQDLRKALPDKTPLSMTALASFCLGDRWLDGLPVDEAVPMIFRMGADDKRIKNFLAAGNDFGEPLCRQSYGIAVDEPFEMKFDRTRRLYVFNVRPWSASDVAVLEERIQKR